MRALLTGLVAAAVAVGACGPREVDVRTAPQSQSDVAVQVTNNLSQAVNVYVVSGGEEVFLGQVPAQSAQRLMAGGVASGSTVTLRARTADGSRTYSRDNVIVSGTYGWQVP